MPTVLAILADGFEEIEAIAPIDLLRRAKVTVTIATPSHSRLVKGRCDITLQADALLDEIDSSDFDCLLLPGGPHVKILRSELRVRNIVLSFAKNNRWIAAICAAPLLLHDLDLLKGKRYTAHFSAANELHEIMADHRVVVDGRLITSRGAGTSIEFGLAVIDNLLSTKTSREISVSICH